MNETEQKRRGRPKKVQVDVEPVAQDSEQDSETVEVAEEVVAQHSEPDKTPEPDMYYTAHKYKIGDVVWVPVNAVRNIGSVFGTIKATQMYTPQKMTISCVVFTNHIMYKFKQSTKLVLAENYVFKDQSDCLKLCNKLMER